MEVEISPKARAKVLYDAGCRSAIILARGAGVCIRAAYNYLAEFKEGASCERKNYKPRKKLEELQSLNKRWSVERRKESIFILLGR